MIVPASLWSALALWFRLPAPEGLRALAAGLFAIFGLATVAALFSRRRWGAVIAFALAFSGLMVWWGAIEPRPTATGLPTSRGRQQARSTATF